MPATHTHTLTTTKAGQKHWLWPRAGSSAPQVKAEEQPGVRYSGSEYSPNDWLAETCRVPSRGMTVGGRDWVGSHTVRRCLVGEPPQPRHHGDARRNARRRAFGPEGRQR